MANALIATPLAPDANCYVTVAEADVYFATARLYSTGWAALDTDTVKAPALIWASSLLDRCMAWAGAASTSTQGMRWPRYGAQNPDGKYYDGNTIPKPLKDAVCDTAFGLTQRNITQLPQLLGQGFKSVKVGEIAIEVDNTMVVNMIPDNLLSVLAGAGLGVLSDDYISSGAGRTVKLVRT